MKLAKRAGSLLMAVLLVLSLSACNSIGRTGKNPDAGIDGKTQGKTEKKVLTGTVDFPTYSSLSDLTTSAEYIVYGVVLSKSCEWMSLRLPETGEDDYLNPGGDVDNNPTLVTIFQVRVIESYAGTASKDDVLKVMMLGGETDDTIYTIEGSPEIQTNAEYVFFLSGSALVENGAWLLNNDQSLYPTDGETITGLTAQSFALSFEQLDKLRKD